MLDFNHQPKLDEALSALLDEALAREHAARTPREYLGASRLGAACERALQYEFAQAPVDPGRELPGRVLRIFEVGRVPLPDDVLAYHKEKIAERAKAENRAPVFQMVVDDIYAISKSKLIGRPR